jgi:hypothetical protein
MAEDLVFISAQLALILSTTFFDASLIEGVHNSRQGAEQAQFSEGSSTYGHSVLENKSRSFEFRRRTRESGESGYLSTLSGRRARNGLAVAAMGCK